MPTAAIVAFRLGHLDGVSVEAAKWCASLQRLGWDVHTVAGAGSADTVVPGLALDAAAPVDVDALRTALAGADVVVVENVLSLPLNPAASAAVAAVCRGRPSVLHHHDLPWQRERFASGRYQVPDDPSWRHVTINDLSRHELAARGVVAMTIRNTFDTDATAPAWARRDTRRRLGVATGEWLVVQPTRAIERKNVPAAVALAEALGAVFWLLGPAEEGYGPTLGRVLDASRVRWIHGDGGTGVADNVALAYAAADLVAFPSRWEGFGNPVVESAIFRRPLAIRRYPVARELEHFGFRWLGVDDHDAARHWLAHPDEDWLDHNHEVARRHFSLPSLDAAIADLMRGW